jgi:phosphatidylglycerophosphate synthase
MRTSTPEFRDGGLPPRRYSCAGEHDSPALTPVPDVPPVTRVGEVLDPIADRTFMIAAVVWLTVDGSIPLWTLPILLLRDVGVVFGALIVMAIQPRVRLPSRAAGKLLTWLQFVAVGLILLKPDLVSVIVAPIAIVGAVALVDYGSQALSALKARA